MTNKSIGTLRTLLKFAQGRGYPAINAATDVKKFKVDAHGGRILDHSVLTPTEIARLITAANPEWPAASACLRMAACAWANSWACNGAMWVLEENAS